MVAIPPEVLDMTDMEQSLKQCMLLSPYPGKKVLTPDELNTYQRWMVENSDSNLRHSNAQAAMAAFPNITRSKITLDYIHALADSPERSVSLLHHEDTIRESEEILTDHDISVGRMMRYFPGHWHTTEYFEIYFALSGNCPVYFEKEVVSVKPGTVLIVAPSVVHATPCYADDAVLLYYMIRSSTFDRAFWNLLPPGNLMTTFFRRALSNQHGTAYLHFETGDDPDISALLYQIYQEYCHSAPYSAQLLNALMSTFFILLLRRYEGTARLPRTEDFFWKHEFSEILTYIQLHYATATIKTVATHFHYSERQIGRIVQNCTCLSFAQLLLKLRMENAARLLQQRGTSIDSIAATVGYASPCSFYRAFSKYYGCTPRTYEIPTSVSDRKA